MSVVVAPFEFPPKLLGSWRVLDADGRKQWLDRAMRRHFSKTNPVVRSKQPGRIVAVNGVVVDNLLGFFCTIGEAVNGPGGYFGLRMEAFDDCLFGGFGLESPYTIVWRHSQISSQVLDSQALLDYVKSDCGNVEDASEEGLEWLRETTDAAFAGTLTLFDELVERIQSVSRRGRVQATLILR